MKRFEKLSKKLSFLLRHHPERYGIDLSPDGSAGVELVARRLGVRRRDIEELIRAQSKRRFELRRSKIRTLYGHTIKVEFATHQKEPPCYLYHGTSQNSVQKIFKDGLLPVKRRWVHLSETNEEAFAVGLRKDPNPVILQVKAREAFRQKLPLHKSGDVWLCDKAPPRFVEVANKIDQISDGGICEKMCDRRKFKKMSLHLQTLRQEGYML